MRYRLYKIVVDFFERGYDHGMCLVDTADNFNDKGLGDTKIYKCIWSKNCEKIRVDDVIAIREDEDKLLMEADNIEEITQKHFLDLL